MAMIGWIALVAGHTLLKAINAPTLDGCLQMGYQQICLQDKTGPDPLYIGL